MHEWMTWVLAMKQKDKSATKEDTKAHFPLSEFVRANTNKVGTDSTFSLQFFSLLTNH